FFSSRRRHTRFSRDWSSDVCSSDLSAQAAYWTADARYRMKKYDEAISDYRKVLAMQSVPVGLQWESRYNIGYAYYEKANDFEAQGKLAQKRDMLQKSIEEFRFSCKQIILMRKREPMQVCELQMLTTY